MSPLRILHLEDDSNDALLVEGVLRRHGLAPVMVVAPNARDYADALRDGPFDLILSDSSVPGFSAIAALHLAGIRQPTVPFVCVTGSDDQQIRRTLLAAGALDLVVKDNLSRLPDVVRTALDRPRSARGRNERRPALVLAAAVQALSLAQDVETVRSIVLRAARELVGADGATFVLRDGDLCHYVDEDAIGPLWKDRKFPLSACISGWAMLNRQSAAIEDIYADPRIPADAYRPTFVQSLVMSPIRIADPIGAVGTYWANHHRAGPEEVELLQALADSTAVALANIALIHDLERRVRERTMQLHATNQELEAFSFSVSHDLRAPLRAIKGFAELIREDLGDSWDAQTQGRFARVIAATEHMGSLIENLLRLSRVSRGELRRMPVDLSDLATHIGEQLAAGHPGREVRFTVAPGLIASGDIGLLDSALSNLLSNAWKYTSRRSGPAHIEFGVADQPGGERAFFVRDNGAGFDMAQARRLFTPFQRLHPASEFPGTGVGLATVQRVIHRHGGVIWAESQPDQGATFYFTLPDPA